MKSKIWNLPFDHVLELLIAPSVKLRLGVSNLRVGCGLGGPALAGRRICYIAPAPGCTCRFRVRVRCGLVVRISRCPQAVWVGFLVKFSDDLQVGFRVKCIKNRGKVEEKQSSNQAQEK